MNIRVAIYLCVFCFLSCEQKENESKSIKKKDWPKRFSETTEDGLKNGRTVKFRPNGDTLEISYWKLDTLHGLVKKFYSKNRLRSIGYMKNGLKHGQYNLYSIKGYIKEKGKYYNDILIDFIQYDEGGKILDRKPHLRAVNTSVIDKDSVKVDFEIIGKAFKSTTVILGDTSKTLMELKKGEGLEFSNDTFSLILPKNQDYLQGFLVNHEMFMPKDYNGDSLGRAKPKSYFFFEKNDKGEFE